jgi:transcription initiation factor TFIID subunit 2
MAVFMDQWVRMGGHAKFFMKFVFNRKRNTVELEINQDAANNKEIGVRKYVGPVLVALQELDGQFRHSFQVLKAAGWQTERNMLCKTVHGFA